MRSAQIAGLLALPRLLKEGLRRVLLLPCGGISRLVREPRDIPMDNLGLVLGRTQIGYCLLQEHFGAANLCRGKLDLAKDMILQAINDLTGLDFGSGFVVMTNFD
jgi:hypothetical protein